MRRTLTFSFGLVVGLALLALAAHATVNRITAEWFERDLRLRAQLAVTSAEQSLSAAWGGGEDNLVRTLNAITRDERISAAAACSAGGAMLAGTELYPAIFSCPTLLARMQLESLPADSAWSMDTELPAGPVQLTAVKLSTGVAHGGFVVLVQDLGFWLRREATTRSLFLFGFFFLALAAAAITLFAARIARRRWSEQLRDALVGTPSTEFQPLVSDLRRLATRYLSEERQEAAVGVWNPDRLRATLHQHLRGERIVVLANRAPYMHIRTSAGVQVSHPASGLVTALEPVMRACSGVWVAHGSGSADRETVDAHDRVAVPPSAPAYSLRRVWLSDDEEKGYYYGFANEGLWPLCHIAHARPVFRSEDFAHYEHVNAKFARAVCEEVDSEDPIVLVQDYHFALAPRMIRRQLPRATILTFWHIPWPNAERFGISPFHDEIVTGLLGSSIIGFHTQQHCNNFLDSIDAFLECRIDREANAVVYRGHRCLVRPYPISIEWPVGWVESAPPVDECRRSVRQELGLGPDMLLGVGVDRLDYTKGIEERLLAVDELLQSYPALRGRFVFAQLSAPSRTKIERYRELNERIERVTSEINQRWGTPSYRPIALLRSHHEPPQVFRYYRAADVCYVSSLHDGMNLVAKEFVAARDDEQGVLVLSQFTGAARELNEALIVNPYDLPQAAHAMHAAIHMPPEEQRERMRAMRRLVAQFNVYRWAGRMLVDAAELRRRERLSGRLNHADVAADSPKVVRLRTRKGS
jgi:trehalose 6-phosphate synthase